MGNVNKLSSQTTPLDYYLHDLNHQIVKDQLLGNGRFLKTIKCQHSSYDEGALVVKIYVKDGNTSLKEQEQQLNEIYNSFLQIRNPNVFPYQRWIPTDKAGYLIRQYFKHNLYDRIGTRPFLTSIEKKWIIYQALKALSQSHFYGICHGDIKCENIMLTSWNWLYLTDFASYKPTYIPEDGPLDVTYFFDTGERGTCYLAPERFYSSSSRKEVPEGQLTPAMDIFSLGCCIAELFLEGVSDPIFSFSQLLSYRKGEYDPAPVIQKIKDEPIQSLIKHMIQREPSKRHRDVGKYVDDWTPHVFPCYFGFLHSYMAKLMQMDADKKISTIQKDFEEIRRQFTRSWESSRRGGSLHEEQSPSQNYPADKEKSISPSLGSSPPFSTVVPPSPKDTSYALLLETETFINRLESTDGGNIEPASKKDMTWSARSSTPSSPPSIDEKETTKEGVAIGETINSETLLLRPPSLPTASNTFVPPEGSEGFVMILDMVCSTMRNVHTVLSKLTVLDIFQKMTPYLDDKCRLQRVVPYVVTLLSDPHALLRATALRTLTKVLDKVTQFPPGDSHIFPEYILPALADFHSAKEEIVREAFAENLAQLAEIARRFLEASQFFKQMSMSELSPATIDWGSGGAGPASGVLRSQAYDAELAEIHNAFQDFVVNILTQETSPLVKRCLLMDITRLCIFFGREKTVNTLLRYIITHEILNGNGPWELRAAFFHNIVGVSAFVGMDDLEKYILPCIDHALADEEEFVIDKAVNCIASLCELGLFRKQILFRVASDTAPMLLHPNTWIRFGSSLFTINYLRYH